MITLHALGEFFLCVPEMFCQVVVILGVWTSVALYFLARPRYKVFMVIAAFLGMLATLFGMCYYLVQSHRWISVTQPTVLYAGPGPNYHAIAQCSARELLCVTRDHKQWLCVTSKAGKGWLPVK